MWKESRITWRIVVGVDVDVEISFTSLITASRELQARQSEPNILNVDDEDDEEEKSRYCDCGFVLMKVQNAEF